MKYTYGAAVLAAGLATATASDPLVSTALEFLARASTTSEVLTLNLTNLAILLGLKLLIFGFGIFSSVGGGTGTGRSDEGESIIKQSDLTGGMCFMMFTAGDDEKLSCVQRSACEDPKTATDYLTAAKMWHKLNSFMKVIPFKRTYFDIMTAVESATSHSLEGGDCKIYSW